MECEKLAQEKTEMQRHYVMVCLSRVYITHSLLLSVKSEFYWLHFLIFGVWQVQFSYHLCHSV